MFKNSTNFHEICRLCLLESSKLKSVFNNIRSISNEKDIANKILTCLNIKITKEDKYSKQICENCLKKLDSFYEFWTSSNHYQQLLERLANSIKTSENVGTTKLATVTTAIETLENGQHKSHRNEKSNESNKEIVTIDLVDDQEQAEINVNNHQSSNPSQMLPILNLSSNTSQTLPILNSSCNPSQKVSALMPPLVLLNNQSLLVPQQLGTQPKQVFLILQKIDKPNTPNRISNPLVNKPPILINNPNAKASNNNASDAQPSNTSEVQESNLGETHYIHKGGLYDYPKLVEDIVCEYCDKVCKSKYNLTLHKRRHTGERPFKCNLPGCTKTYPSMSNLKEHLKYSHSDERPFICKICNKSYKKLGELETHIKHIHGGKTYHCNICSYSTFKKTLLEIHNYTHSSKPQHVCSICGKSFFSKNSFRTHSYLHNTAKIFSCKLCNEKFTDPYKLQSHRGKFHKKVTTCPECGKTFKSRRSFKMHKERDHDGIRYHCYECGQEVVNKFSLITHIRRHTGERPFKCNICKKNFISRSVLRQHTVVHTKEKRYVCTICNKRYSQKSSLNTHNKKVHPTPITSDEEEEDFEEKLYDIVCVKEEIICEPTIFKEEM